MKEGFVKKGGINPAPTVPKPNLTPVAQGRIGPPVLGLMGLRFPHAALEPFEANPRITPEHAARICELVTRASEKGLGDLSCPPAICVAIWQGALVKWLVNDQEAEETIRRLEKALGVT